VRAIDARSFLKKRIGHWACFLGSLAVTALMWPSPAEAAPGRTTTTVGGGWIALVSCAPTSFDPTTGKLTCIGSSAWDGAWTGVTHYTASAVLNLATGDIRGTIDEVFTGVYTVNDAMGTLSFHETFHIDGATNALQLTATIIGSSGDPTFQCSQGRVTFDGFVPIVTGAGGYEGKWTHGCARKAA
jgi:hypothetical protein